MTSLTRKNLYWIICLLTTSGLFAQNKIAESKNGYPNATISASSNACQKDVSPIITFTGSGGSGSYTFTYKINGGATRTLSTSTSGISIIQSTAVAEKLDYNLISVRDQITGYTTHLDCHAEITINSLPTAMISGSTEVCVNDSMPIIKLTGLGGSGNYIFTFKINGGAIKTVNTTTGVVAISQPTSNSGTFNYELLSVENAVTGCKNLISKSAIITIKPSTSAVTNISSETDLMTENRNNQLLIRTTNKLSGSNYRLINTIGTTIKSGTFNNNLTIIDTHSYPKGIYFLKIENDSKRSIKIALR